MAVLRSDLCVVAPGIATTSSSFVNRRRTDTWLAFSSSSVALHRVGRQPAMRRPDTAVVNVVAARRITLAERICTADELHHVSVPNSDWRLALWRYLPSPKAPSRNHPLLLLSGVGTNAVGYDLSPESSFARFMSGYGFDTWILELRGAGLSSLGVDFGDKNLDSATSSVKAKTRGMLPIDDKSHIVSNLFGLPEKIERFLNGEAGKNSAVSRIFNLQAHLGVRLEDFQKQLDLIPEYDWDFDHYLEEDVPAAMDYVRSQSKPKDGKLLAVGHSMGGILLYSMLSKFSFEGSNSGLASIVTLASSLDYTSSRSSLKLLIPLKEPAQTLNVSFIPIGGLLAVAYPFASFPPYALSWLTPQISAPEMMSPELLEKLVLNNFCTVPAKLLIQLITAFQEGGLRDRNGTFFYKDHIGKSSVPILALAGDRDLICPPEAVYETVKLIPEHLVTYKVLGEPGGPHYAHYDLVGGRLAAKEVYPCIIEFLDRHDEI